MLTGIAVSRGTQQRLVHRQSFEEPVGTAIVEKMSLDGDKVRLRTPKGQACQWRDYKAVNLHEQRIAARFQDNGGFIECQPFWALPSF